MNLDAGDLELIERANRALGRLDGVSSVLPDSGLFVYLYIRKEALLSSQIEGTRSTFSEILAHESLNVPGVPHDDVQEVSNYVEAMNHGLQRIRSGMPLSLRLLREMHTHLLARGRGSDKEPGKFRNRAVWIQGTTASDAVYVPPPAADLMQYLSPFEKFLHDDPESTPVLIKTALAHAQFETIHPFLDGNGRLGRLLITLLLCSEDVLSEPTLYLSAYFKRHRSEYERRLQRTRTHAEWEEWLRFFFQGLRETATQAVDSARDSLTLFESDRARIREQAPASVLQVHEVLQRRVIVNIKVAADAAGVSEPTAAKALRIMEELGIIVETTGQQRGRRYLYEPYYRLLSKGTELD